MIMASAWAVTAIASFDRRATLGLAAGLLATSAYRPPIDRQPLPLKHLIERHLGCDGVADSQIAFAIAKRRRGGGEVQPFVGQHIVTTDTVTLVVHQAEQILAGRI